MTLYEISATYTALFDEFEAINEWMPDEDENGKFIDDDGDIIDDVVEYKEKMLQAWFDTLEGIEGEFNEKAESLALYIKNLSANAEAIKKEKQKLEKRQKAIENRAEQMKMYLLENMQKLKLKKVETARVLVTTRNNAESTYVLNEDSLIEWAQKNNDDLLNYPKPKISKTAVKNAIKSGKEIPFCQLIQTQSLMIK